MSGWRRKDVRRDGGRWGRVGLAEDGSEEVMEIADAYADIPAAERELLVRYRCLLPQSPR